MNPITGSLICLAASIFAFVTSEYRPTRILCGLGILGTSLLTIGTLLSHYNFI